MVRPATSGTNKEYSVRTIGVDLSASAKGTGTCVVAWDQGEPLVEAVAIGGEDDVLVPMLAGRDVGDVAGIDCPFGWPLASSRG